MKLAAACLLCFFVVGPTAWAVEHDLGHQVSSYAAPKRDSTTAPTASIYPPVPVNNSQTRWFCALCGGAVVILIRQLYPARKTQRLERARAMSAGRLEERERIARELHDTLIQSIQGLILMLQSVASRLPKADGIRTQMEAALDRAGELLDEARDRVSDLRTSNVPTDIARALSESARTLALPQGAVFRLEVSGIPQSLEYVVAENLYSTAREAMANAFSHAHAKSIEVQIAYRERSLHLCIRDDGVGIDSDMTHPENKSLHFGIQGMRERAKQIGARLDIWSRTGVGTEVELEVPAALAYQFHCQSRWARMFPGSSAFTEVHRHRRQRNWRPTESYFSHDVPIRERTH